jgi:hypothetical protein
MVGNPSFRSVCLLAFAACGCFTLSHPLPPVNLRDPGWTVYQGQAVWKLPKTQHDIAGDVVVATGPGGRSFVQFSKTPFPLVTGQTTAKGWQVEFPPQSKHYAGPGNPPKRIMWLYLPRVLRGDPAPAHWSWTNAMGNWKLENPATGEALEGFFSQ